MQKLLLPSRVLTLLVSGMFHEAAQVPLRADAFTASDGAAGDGFGSSVSVSASFGLSGSPSDDIGTNVDQGSAYIFRPLNDYQLTTQVAKLIASDGATGDGFGASASQSQRGALVGASNDDVGTSINQGSAYVFRIPEVMSVTLTQNAKLVASDGAAGDRFGSSLSQLGSIGLVGASGDDVGMNIDQGSAYLFRNLDSVAGIVTESARLTASDGGAGDGFGASVSQSASIGVVGALNGDVGNNADQGIAYVFRNLDSGTGMLTENTKLFASDGRAGDGFGSSVSHSGSIGLVGATNADVGTNTDQGSAYVFRSLDSASGTVGQNVKLAASDGAANDHFGWSVSQSGTSGLVGAPDDDRDFGLTSNQGSVYVFRNLDTASGTVSQSVKLLAADGSFGDRFGFSVSLDGDRFMIAAPFNSGGKGKIYTGRVSSVTTANTGNSYDNTSGLSFVSQDDWIIGETTDNNEVYLSTGSTASVVAAGKGIYIGKNAGSDGNILHVGGQVTTSKIWVGAASGTQGNTLDIFHAGKVTASEIVVNSGGTLLLSGTTTAFDRLGAATAVTLARGGKFNSGGLQEGSFGMLKLAGGSSIDFGLNVNSMGSALLAASGQVTEPGVISIFNWSGTAGADDGRYENDRLLFKADPSLTADQLAQFQFYDDAGLALPPDATQIAYYDMFEVVPTPAPEPSSLLFAVASLAGVAAFRRPRREFLARSSKQLHG